MPIWYNFTIADAKGDTSVTSIPLETATDMGIATLGIAFMAPLINALTDGGLVNASISIDVDLSAQWGPVATLDSDVQEKAFFSFHVNGASGPRTFTVPTIKESLFVPGSKLIDVGAAAVANFINALEDGISVTGGTVTFGNHNGLPLTILKQAREAWGKYRKG